MSFEDEMTHELLKNAMNCISSLSKACYIDSYKERIQEYSRVMDLYFDTSMEIYKGEGSETKERL